MRFSANAGLERTDHRAPGASRLGKETPCPHLAPHFTALARARNSAPNVAAMDDADRLLRRAERVESIARSRIDRHGVELAILELEALRRGDPDGEVLASREGWQSSISISTSTVVSVQPEYSPPITPPKPNTRASSAMTHIDGATS